MAATLWAAPGSQPASTFIKLKLQDSMLFIAATEKVGQGQDGAEAGAWVKASQGNTSTVLQAKTWQVHEERWQSGDQS